MPKKWADIFGLQWSWTDIFGLPEDLLDWPCRLCMCWVPSVGVHDVRGSHNECMNTLRSKFEFTNTSVQVHYEVQFKDKTIQQPEE